MIPPPPRSTLFPYTTLFRSQLGHRRPAEVLHAHPGKVEPRGRNAQDVGWSHADRSEEHTSELQSQFHLVCRLLLEKKKKKKKNTIIFSTEYIEYLANTDCCY